MPLSPVLSRLVSGALRAGLFFCFLGGAPAALAKTDAGPKEPLLQADRLSFDENTGVVTATGNVEVALGDQILRADKITYDKNTNVVRAAGRIALTQSTGEILYAKELEITSDMKEAFLNNVRILFPDESRLAANDAQRFEGRYLITDKGVYSACSLCADDPSAPPLWQIKGKRITHDAQEKKVIYRDATVEFGGVPLFYTPYLVHPDPSVKRQSGFLTPSVGHTQALGLMSSLPYYYPFAPNHDLVLAPTFSEADGIQMGAEWRYRTDNGSMRWSGSFTRTDFINQDGFDRGYQWRGHLFGTTRFDISDAWRAGTDVAFASDKSYMPRYKISSEDLLVNRAFAERFKGRSYAVGNMYYFQDMRPGGRQKEPFVAPELRYSAYGEPNRTLGGRWALNTGLLVTTREKNVSPSQQGPNTRRLSFDAGWERQMVSQTGFLTTVSVLGRTDAYWADNVPRYANNEVSYFDKVERLRPFIQGDVTVRYPFGRRGDGYQQILEPLAVLSLAPRMKRESVLPNEDSLDVEFDETNLFSTNRFTGIDRLEGGSRVAYGVRHELVTDAGGRISMLGGQVFRTRKDLSFPKGSGLSDTLSDYVGHVGFSPSRYVSADYGFRVSPDDLSFSRQQFSTSAGPKVFRPSLRYLFSRETETQTTAVEKLEEGALGFTSSFAKFWSFAAYHSHAFQPAPGPRSTSLSVSYKDECFEATLSGVREHTVRTDVESGTSVIFRFFMKNIGGWGSD